MNRITKYKLLLYCTKGKPYLYYAQESRTLMEIDNSFEGYKITNKNVDDYLNGKIVAECDFEVEEISRIKSWNSTEDYDWEYETPTLCYYDLLRKSCLMCDEFEEYIEFNGYAIHINNLHIFDEPKALNEYYGLIPKKVNTLNGSCYINESIEKAPQNMMYAIDDNDKEYVLISIQPQWICKILNGEKTVEVRKKVLNEMLEPVKISNFLELEKRRTRR